MYQQRIALPLNSDVTLAFSTLWPTPYTINRTSKVLQGFTRYHGGGGLQPEKKTRKKPKKPVPNLKFAVAFVFFRYFSVFFGFFGFFRFFRFFVVLFRFFSV